MSNSSVCVRYGRKLEGMELGLKAQPPQRLPEWKSGVIRVHVILSSGANAWLAEATYHLPTQPTYLPESPLPPTIINLVSGRMWFQVVC